MSTSIVMSDKRKALLAYKEKILKELDYYGSRIAEISTSRSKSSFIEDSDSSDSEAEFTLSVDIGPSVPQLKQQQSAFKTCLQATQELTSLQVLQSEVNVLVEDPVIEGSDSEAEFTLSVDIGPSVPQLKQQQSAFKTCLQATQELTSLQVLQYEVNVLVEDPVIEGEPPVTESGVWREVTAECRVDLVPFSIAFYVHQPDRQFGSRRYRSVRAVAVRAAHGAELESTVLGAVSTPSDAVEVLKNYACAHRSRRTTLARLAAKYNDTLHMEPMPEGGYILKCANLLEVSWTLQNKWSPIAPFHHRMKFNLEYMDESYIKIITQAHRQLSDPTIETDERTYLLSKIISTCLEAQGPTQELYESMSSDPETTQSLKKRRTTLDQEPDHPIVSKNKDREVMAPPKSLPKKAKPKGKENVVENRKTKRVTEDFSKAKKARVDEVDGELKSIKNNVVNDDKVNEKDRDNICPNKRESAKNNVALPKKSVNKDNNNIDKVNEKDSDKISPKNRESTKNNVVEQKKSANNDNNNIDKGNEKQSNRINPKNRVGTKNNVAVPKKSVIKENDNIDKVNEKDDDKISPKSRESTKTNVAKTKNMETVKITKPNSNADKVKKSANSKVNADNNEIINKVTTNEKTKTIKVKKNDNTKKDMDKPKDNFNSKNNEDNRKDEYPSKLNKNNDKVKKVPSKETISVKKSNENVTNKVVKDNANAKTNEAAKKNEPTTQLAHNKVKAKKVTSKETVSVENSDKTGKNKVLKSDNVESLSNNNENKEKVKSVPPKPKTADENTKKTAKTKIVKENNNVNKEKLTSTISKSAVKSTDKNKIAKDNVKGIASTKKISTNNEQDLVKNKQDSVKTKPLTAKKDKPTKVVENKLTTNKENTKNINNEKETTIEKAVEKNTNLKRKSNVADKDADTNVATTKKPKLSKPVAQKEINNKENDLNKPQNIKPITKQKPKFITNSMKTLKTGNIRGVFNVGNISKQSSERASKIPQKKLSSVSEATLKKNPLRISPRKIPSKFKTPAATGNKYLVAQKTTSIPRLMKKPSPKT